MTMLRNAPAMVDPVAGLPSFRDKINTINSFKSPPGDGIQTSSGVGTEVTTTLVPLH